MNAGEYAGTVLATALGGFDPAPMVIMAAALGAGVRRRHIMGASALLLGGTAAWGVALTLLAGPRLQSVDWWALVRHGGTAAWVEVGLAVVVGGYALWRAVSRRRARGEPTPEKPAASPWALYATSLVFVGIVVFDIPFDIHVAVAASQPLPRVVLGWVAWALLSQIALTALVLLTLLGGRSGSPRSCGARGQPSRPGSRWSSPPCWAWRPCSCCWTRVCSCGQDGS